MNRQEFLQRRARIVRRWAAYRIGRAQREAWKRRKQRAGKESHEDSDSVGDYDLLDELPDGLLG